MNYDVFMMLSVDAITNAAIYALLALALVLVFTVTRVIFLPQGEFVAFGALTLMGLQMGHVPGTVWLLWVLAVFSAIADVHSCWRNDEMDTLWKRLVWTFSAPLLVLLVVWAVPELDQMPLLLQIVLSLLITAPMGVYLYRVAFQPVANQSNLFLLILAMAVHIAFLSLGLYMFGADANRTPNFTDGMVEVAGTFISFQALWIISVTVLVMALLYVFFEKSFYGRALRATAFNRLGARLVGIPTEMAGKLAFGVAAFMGALCGILASPLTLIYYDSGFLAGLKGFVAAIFGGLMSFPLAVVGALVIAFLEAFGAFWASEYKEVIVFTLIIPILLVRSMGTKHSDEDS